MKRSRVDADPILREKVAKAIALEDAVQPAPASNTRQTLSPYTGKGNKKGMSKNEARFHAHLEGLMRDGCVAAFRYEPASWRLPAARAHYRADFLVSFVGLAFSAPAWSTGHPFALVEVKPRGKDGRPYFGPRGRLKVKLAAQALAGLLPVVVVWPLKEGGWGHEVIEADVVSVSEDVYERLVKREPARTS